MSLSSYCVQFIGITLLNITDFDSSMSDLKCAFKRRSNIERLGLAFIEKLPEHHFKPYTAALFYCSLNKYTADLTSIDYATLYRFSVSTWLQTTYLAPDASSDITVNLCVRPYMGYFLLSIL
ncbi:glycosyltransferase family 92 protein [Caerostris extrusa]|uniref:Glycosyltransferase family 92 protein n=1 Tax=Caerostris extrusa TaxID=172846 RepID=A0AAV4W2L3_CAEEX|nr:glycosyltransferase family 92 protein [Caerostris extrusa]